jgi:hypothetical protein
MADKPTEKISHYALSEDDIRKLAGNVPIMRYPELKKFSTPDEMFNGKKAVVLLFLTENNDNGHWLTVLNHPDKIEVFDSYGVSTCGFLWLFFEGQKWPLRSVVKVTSKRPGLNSYYTSKHPYHSKN